MHDPMSNRRWERRRLYVRGDSFWFPFSLCACFILLLPFISKLHDFHNELNDWLDKGGTLL